MKINNPPYLDHKHYKNLKFKTHKKLKAVLNYV